MYYPAVASPRVRCATIRIHILTAASRELARAQLRFCYACVIIVIVIIIITMCDSVRHCSTVRQGEWQFVAVRMAVCSSALAVVYVRQCMWQCAAVRHCAAVRNSLRQCVRQYAAVCGSAHGNV
jgi:hypothetical protein